MSTQLRQGATNVVVASTVMLSFISFWRAAAIVLGDLGSSAFYAGGIAEAAVGASAPWFVLGIMFFSFAVRAVYLESCGMFVRGGVYVVVRDAMGPFMARLSVSALIFDYVLTGPISGVTAGQYLGRILNELSAASGSELHVPPDLFAAACGVAVAVFFWRQNVRGIHESSSSALRIMQVTTVMFVLMLGWGALTMLVRGPSQIPPAPLPHNLHFAPHAVGWFKGTFWLSVPVVAITVALGHSLLAMSGFETLAQVYREIEHPKMDNPRRTALIVCSYAVVCTGVVTVLASLIIPDTVRGEYTENMLGGLAMHLAGPPALRLAFHAFVVLTGFLILAAAVNTSLIGANGVMNRLAEDGVLVPWFRKPHKRFGTTARILHLIVALQLATIVLSRGNVLLISEAYAFGVVWSFFLKACGVLVLRFKRTDQQYRVPGNIHIGGREWPLGLLATTAALGFMAMVSLFSKQLATIYGVAFTVALFVVFTVSERYNARRRDEGAGLEQFSLQLEPAMSAGAVQVRPGCVLIAVRDGNRLHHVRAALAKTNLSRQDIVVMTVRPVNTGDSEYALAEHQIFTDYEQGLFSRVVAAAETAGKHVNLLVVPANDPFDALVQTAAAVRAAKIVTGVSEQMSNEELARRIGAAWERLPAPRHAFSLQILPLGRSSTYVNLGPHPPRLWPEDLDRLHALWMELSDRFGSRLHHRDVVGVALRRLERELRGPTREQALREVANEINLAKP